MDIKSQSVEHIIPNNPGQIVQHRLEIISCSFLMEIEMEGLHSFKSKLINHLLRFLTQLFLLRFILT